MLNLAVDVDGTLVDVYKSDDGLVYEEDLKPEVVKKLQEQRLAIDNIALVTNQGGVAVRYAMETQDWGDPAKFPDKDQVMKRLRGIADQVEEITNIKPRIYVCFAHQYKSGKWAPTPYDIPALDAQIAAAEYNGNDPMVFEVSGPTPPEWSREWRKPATGMLRQFAEDIVIEHKHITFIDDKPENVVAALDDGFEGVLASNYFKSEMY